MLRGIRPILRQGNYGGALLAAVQQFGSRIAQEKGVALEPVQPASRGASGASNGRAPAGSLAIDHRHHPGDPGPALDGPPAAAAADGFLAGMILGDMMGDVAVAVGAAADLAAAAAEAADLEVSAAAIPAAAERPTVGKGSR